MYKKGLALIATVLVMAMAVALPLGLGTSSALACYPPEDPASEPCEIAIESATLGVYLESHGSETIDVYVHRVTAPWTELDVTWNNFDGSFDPVAVASFAAAPTGWHTVDVTELVQGWVDETYPNYGVLLRQEGSDDVCYFWSSEWENVELRPYLEINYSTGDSEITTITVQRPGEEQGDVGDSCIWEIYPDANFGANMLMLETSVDPLCTGNVQALISFEFTIECPDTPEDPPCPCNWWEWFWNWFWSWIFSWFCW